MNMPAVIRIKKLRCEYELSNASYIKSISIYSDSFILRLHRNVYNYSFRHEIGFIKINEVDFESDRFFEFTFESLISFEIAMMKNILSENEAYDRIYSIKFISSEFNFQIAPADYPEFMSISIRFGSHELKIGKPEYEYKDYV